MNYYKVLGIKEDVYNKYDNCGDEQIKLKIQRLILEKGFKTPTIVKETFETAVNTYIKDVIPPQEENRPSSSGGGGGGGVVGSIDEPVSSTVTEMPQNSSFGDCNENHWAFKYVDELKADNIISGYSDGNFYPDKTVKREELVKMIVVLSGVGTGNDISSFADVSEDAWYHTYIASAYTNGLINGVSDTDFGIGSDISRQDVAVIVCRLFSKLGVSTSVDDNEKIFADENEISDYARESVNTLTSMSVLNGFEDGSFRPFDALTRGQAAKLIYGLINR